jgi:hypothetical protein
MMSININYAKFLLQTVAVLHIVVGLCFPWIVESPLFDHYRENLYLAFNVELENAKQQALFLMALFGPTISSWGVLFLYTVNSGFSRPSPQAWWYMIVACLVWAPYDSVYSLQHGIYLNAIINAIAFVVIVASLLSVRKHFFNPNSAE